MEVSDDSRDPVRRSGQNTLSGRCVHRHRDVRLSDGQILGGLGTELHKRHRALTGEPGHQAGPSGDHFQAVGHRQRSGYHRCGDLTHRVADHRIRLDTVVPPQRCQRQLNADQHGLNALDAGDRFARGQHLLQRKPHLGNEIGVQLGNGRRERRLIGKQPPTHAGPLRPLAGVDEHPSRPARSLMRPDHAGRRLTGRERSQAGHRLPIVASAHRREHRMQYPMVIHGVGDIGQCHLGAVSVNPVGQPRRPRGNPLGRLAGQHQRCDRRLVSRGLWSMDSDLRALLQHHMCIGATEAERRNPSPAHMLPRRPILFLCNDFQSHIVELDVGIRGFETAIRRDGSALNRQHSFDEAGDAGGGFQMAQVRLDCADQQWRVGGTAPSQDGTERSRLNRVAQ